MIRLGFCLLAAVSVAACASPPGQDAYVFGSATAHNHRIQTVHPESETGPVELPGGMSGRAGQPVEQLRERDPGEVGN